MLFPSPNTQPDGVRTRPLHVALHLAAAFLLTVAATGVMMLCPCDSVGLREHYAVSLVGLAALLGIGAAIFIFRLMRRDAGDTALLRAFFALVIVFAAIYCELFVAMQAVAWMARPR